MEDSVSTSATPTDTFSSAIERHELNQRSDPSSAARKAEITPPRAPEPEAHHTDLLDAIQMDASDVNALQPEIDRLKEKHAPKEAEAEEAAPELPEALQQADPEKLAEVMEKYGLSPEDLQNDPRWADLVANELSQAEQSAQQPQEPQTPEQQAQYYQQYLGQLQQTVADPTINDPVLVGHFKQELGAVLGANSPESWQSVDRLSSALMTGGLSLMNTVVPRMIQHYLGEALESHLPGISEMHREALIGNTWDSVRSKNPAFADIPSFGTPAFQALAAKVREANPEFDAVEFQDKAGRPLPIREALAKKAELFMKLATGGKPTPEEAKKLVEVGERKATKVQTKVVAARTLGAGKSKGAFPTRSDDSFREAILAYNRAQKSSERSE
jgi:hypothetical protein